MASDTVIAGVAGLLGVGLTGGVQTALAVRSDRRNRRSSSRILAAELDRLGYSLRLALLPSDDRMRYAGLTSLPLSEVYPEHHPVLARELPHRAWQAVAAAHHGYESTRHLAAEKSIPDGVMLMATIQTAQAALREVEQAHLLVVPLRYRRGVRREHQRRADALTIVASPEPS